MDSIAQATYWTIRGNSLFLLLHLLGLVLFGYIVARRLRPLLAAQRDPRFDRPWLRLERVLQYWLGQWRHPRFRYAGILHILIFTGFVILASRAFVLLALGVSDHFAGAPGGWYEVVHAYAATAVLLCMLAAAARRLIWKPARYPRSADAIFLLGLIALLMVADGVFEGSEAAFHHREMAVLSLPWLVGLAAAHAAFPVLRDLHQGAYFVHEFTFFCLLCYRPFGIQFHVETSLFSIYFAKLDRGTVKPVRWGVPDEQLDTVPSFGVKKIEDFTWKHILDFYSCADCGRCADQCPANAVGRPLSPRALSIKTRDYRLPPLPGVRPARDGHAPSGWPYSEEEIWSCTTCGACEAECPLLVEYIDKIVDLRRGLVDDGKAPQSLHKPLKALESRGNPFGKLEKKRADWARGCASGGERSGQHWRRCTSSTASPPMTTASSPSGARPPAFSGASRRTSASSAPKERDSGHDVRRFGEETLFQALRDHNTEAIRASGVRRIVTADPHAYNALRHDYRDVPPVEHISQVLARAVECGPGPAESGRQKAASTRTTIPATWAGITASTRTRATCSTAIPGLRRVEMKRCRDRSFCCGGGGLALFYEAKGEGAHGRAAGPHGGGSGRQRDGDGVPVLHGEHRRRHQGRGAWKGR